MSPEYSYSPLHLSSPREISQIPEVPEEWQEIIQNWEKMLPKIKKESPLVASVLEAALKKIKNAQEYSQSTTKNNVLKIASLFLSVLGFYINSPSFSKNPPKNMEELIEGLNSLNPELPFLKPGDTFKDFQGRTFKILEIYPPSTSPDGLGNIPPDKLTGSFCSGNNQWDIPSSNGLFLPGKYLLEEEISE